MWMFGTDFFVSVVAKDPAGQDRLCVRARLPGDLDRARHWCPELTASERNAGTDYEWRAYASREDWARAVARMVLSIDYPNFKDATQDIVRHRVHTRVWGSVRGLTVGPTQPGQLVPGWDNWDDDEWVRDPLFGPIFCTCEERFGGTVADIMCPVHGALTGGRDD